MGVGIFLWLLMQDKETKKDSKKGGSGGFGTHSDSGIHFNLSSIRGSGGNLVIVIDDARWI